MTRVAAKYRKLNPRMWDDEKFARLSTEEKLMAVWLLTGPRTLRCGFVLWSPGLASDHTGINGNRIDTVCHTVCHTLNWGFDPDSKTVFFPNWYRYNQVDNEKHLKGCLSDLEDVPATPLFARIPEQKQHIANWFHTVWDTLTEGYRNRIETVSPQEQEQEQDIKNPPNPPKGGKRERFKPPSVEEVAAYCRERQNDIDPEAFVAHYAAKGWRIGSTPMKDWKQAVVTWEVRRREESQASPQDQPTENPYAAMDRAQREYEQQQRNTS